MNQELTLLGTGTSAINTDKEGLGENGSMSADLHEGILSSFKKLTTHCRNNVICIIVILVIISSFHFIKVFVSCDKEMHACALSHVTREH